MTSTSRLSPRPDHSGIGLSGLIPDPGFRAAVSLAGLGASLWAISAMLPPAPGIVVLVAMAVGGLAWLVLTFMPNGPLVLAAVAMLGAAGGVIATTDTNGPVFVGIASGCAAVTFGLTTATVLVAAAPAAFAVAAAAQGVLPGRLLEIVAVCLAGMVSGTARHQIVQRARNARLVATARQHAEVARAEAELFGERNRLGRELHDVLAHTLGALSIQLTAMDTLARTGAGRDKLLTAIEHGHQLVGEGLDEARQAIHALRDDTVPLVEQLERLCELHHAGLEISGPARQVRAEASLLYRVAQEALTNAAKHAPGADVSVRLGFGSVEVTVSVRNSAPGPSARSRLHGTGGGYGLRGLRERVEQAGGEFRADVTADGGWQVDARIPG